MDTSNAEVAEASVPKVSGDRCIGIGDLSCSAVRKKGQLGGGRKALRGKERRLEAGADSIMNPMFGEWDTGAVR